MQAGDAGLMSTEVNAIIAELQEQLRVLSSRAAQLAGRLAIVTQERDKFQKKLGDEDKDSAGSE